MSAKVTRTLLKNIYTQKLTGITLNQIDQHIEKIDKFVSGLQSGTIEVDDLMKVLATARLTLVHDPFLVSIGYNPKQGLPKSKYLTESDIKALDDKLNGTLLMYPHLIPVIDQLIEYGVKADTIIGSANASVRLINEFHQYYGMIALAQHLSIIKVKPILDKLFKFLPGEMLFLLTTGIEFLNQSESYIAKLINKKARDEFMKRLLATKYKLAEIGIEYIDIMRQHDSSLFVEMLANSTIDLAKAVFPNIETLNDLRYAYEKIREETERRLAEEFGVSEVDKIFEQMVETAEGEKAESEEIEEMFD